MDYLSSSVVLLSLDSVYLHTTKNYFKDMVKDIQKVPLTARIFPIILCYIFVLFALYYFIIEPKRNVNDAFLLGFCMYGMFETLNYGLFKNWRILPVIFDSLWGGVLFALTTYITYRLTGKKQYI
jgi:uncharacterized membrane protein